MSDASHVKHCSKCLVNECVPRQRWCARCKKLYMRKTTSEAGTPARASPINTLLCCRSGAGMSTRLAPSPPPGTRAPYLVEREQHILKRIGYWTKSLSLAMDDGDDERAAVVYAQLAGLHTELARVRAPRSEAGHNGRPRVFHEPVDRLECEKEQIEAININVDQLEALAHMDEKFEVLPRLAARKDSKREPLISHMQWQAGRRLQRDYTVMKLEPMGQGGASGSGGATTALADAKCDALHSYGKALAHVGPQNERVLVAIVIDDRDLREVAAAWDASKFAMVPMLRGALDALAAFYGLRERQPKIRSWENPVPFHPFHGEK